MARALALALLLSACAGRDSGVLLEVSRTETLQNQPELLRFMIGTGTGAGEGGPTIADSAASITVSVAGRDLRKEPYRLYVTEGRMPAGSPLSATVLGLRGEEIIGFATLPAFSFQDDTVLLQRMVLMPAAGITIGPTGCLLGAPVAVVGPDDLDCDGTRSPEDCDDADPAVHPGASEVCDNHRDDDCDGQIDEHDDTDGDGVDACSGDCNDRAAEVHPGAAEVCNGVDDNCDGRCDEGMDKDGDGVTACGSRPRADGSCQRVAPDCAEGDIDVFPGATEICDGRDRDCDGLCDDGPEMDPDGDGFTSCGTIAGAEVVSPTLACGLPARDLVDCREGDPVAHPFAHELCNGHDDNCDGVPLVSSPCYGRGEGSACLVGARACDDDDGDHVSGLSGACVPALPTILVETALCDAYQGPSCAGAPDPFRCATAARADSAFDCQLAYRRIPGGSTAPTMVELCPGGVVTLPAPSDAAGCRYTLLGGTGQEQVTAGFDASGGAPAASHTGCTATLSIVALANRFAPQPDELVVFFTEARRTTDAVIQLRVSPTPVATCPPSPLACKMR